MQLLLKAPGVKQVTRNEMLDYLIPESTVSYTPVSNELIIDTALEEFDKQGFIVTGEFYKQATQNKFVGGFTLDGSSIKPGYDFEFAFKNSYDKSMSAGIGLGASVFICSNSSINAEQILKRVHTGNADKVIKEFIQESIKVMYDTYVEITDELDSWKDIPTTKRLCAETVGRLMLEERIISPNQFAVVRKEFDMESFDYGVENSIYNLYQACTHALKSEHPTSFIQTHAKLHQFFTNNFN